MEEVNTRMLWLLCCKVCSLPYWIPVDNYNITYQVIPCDKAETISEHCLIITGHNKSPDIVYRHTAEPIKFAFAINTK
ncbi:MAG: hypothetical protein HOF35_02915 [Bacteroidetes bacterium]|nr:hypothetical protein [Bacteroidota bacterium]